MNINAVGTKDQLFIPEEGPHAEYERIAFMITFGFVVGPYLPERGRAALQALYDALMTEVRI